MRFGIYLLSNMQTETNYLVGIDLGASQLRFIIADEKNGNITSPITGRSSKVSYDSPLSEKGDIFAEPCYAKVPDTGKVALYITRKLQEYLEELGIKRESVTGIGISVAGKIHSDGRFIGSNVPPRYAEKRGRSYGIDIITSLREAFPKGLNIAIENDANCSGLVQATYYKYLGIAPDTTFFITVSTGIGGGGPKRDLDEVGHILVDGYFPKLAPVCGCGASGCIEAYTSGEGIKNQALNILRLFFKDRATFEQLNIFESIRTESRYDLQQIVNRSELKELYRDNANIGAEEIFKLANLDKTGDTTDEFAFYLVETAAERFARVLVSLSNIHGIERFGIGGSVVVNNPGYLDVVGEKISRLYKFRHNVFQNELVIELSPLGEYVADYGALFLVVNPAYEKNWIETIARSLRNDAGGRRA